MNTAQNRVVKKLTKILVEMGEVGLSGGVYDCTFCVWPDGQHPEHNLSFFESVEEVGEMLYTPGVDLDGGAGV